MLAAMLSERLGHDVMNMLSHASDGDVTVTWPWRDGDVESCWQQCCRVMLAMMLLGRHGHDVMQLSSHASDNIAESC
jgi:hypothetical protein